MGSPLPPQKKEANFLNTITNAYVLYIDLTATGANFLADGFEVINLSSIPIYVSWDGVTDALYIDPAIIVAIVRDNFHPPTGKVYLKASANTPLVSVTCWA